MENLFTLSSSTIPYFLILIMVTWSIWKKSKWPAPALLATSFSSAPLFFHLIEEEILLSGNFAVGLSIGKYASLVATIPLAGFGWYLGKKLNLQKAIALSFLGLILNFSVIKTYQNMIKKNSLVLKKEIPLNCEKLPYHCAIRDHDLEKIPNLKKEGKDIETRDSSSRSALWYGLSNPRAVKILLENGANPDGFNIYGETPLAFALVISLKPNLEVAKLLIDHGAQINRTVGFRKKISILNFAIVNENIAAINFALENGANPNIADDYRKTSCQRLSKFSLGEVKNLEKYCKR